MAASPSKEKRAGCRASTRRCCQPQAEGSEGLRRRWRDTVSFPLFPTVCFSSLKPEARFRQSGAFGRGEILFLRSVSNRPTDPTIKRDTVLSRQPPLLPRALPRIPLSLLHLFAGRMGRPSADPSEVSSMPASSSLAENTRRIGLRQAAFNSSPSHDQVG